MDGGRVSQMIFSGQADGQIQHHWTDGPANKFIVRFGYYGGYSFIPIAVHPQLIEV